jgi:hypothetical protein
MRSSTSIQCLLALALSGSVIAAPSPCPYGQLFERGALSDADAAKFIAAREEGEVAVEALAHAEKQKREEHAAQEKFYKRQIEARQLNLGGGLLNGQLQPLTGVLANLGIPT